MAIGQSKCGHRLKPIWSFRGDVVARLATSRLAGGPAEAAETPPAPARLTVGLGHKTQNGIEPGFLAGQSFRRMSTASFKPAEFC